MIRTLVVMPNWVGDCVMALPVLDALDAADRDVTVLAKPHLKSLLALSPAVGDFLSRQGSDPEVVSRIADGNFDEAIVLPNSFRSALWVSRAGIRYRWGYRGNWRGGLLSAAIARPDRRRAQIEDYRELVDELGIQPPASWIPTLELSKKAASGGKGTVAPSKARSPTGPSSGTLPAPSLVRPNAGRWRTSLN